MGERTESIAVRKARTRREAELCGACGKDPCAWKRPKRNQRFAKIKTPSNSGIASQVGVKLLRHRLHAYFLGSTTNW